MTHFPPEEQAHWHNIDTAPKDGTAFLAVTNYGKYCVMRYSMVSGDFVRSVTCRRCDGMGLGGLTHWMPIPVLLTNEVSNG